MKKLFLIKNNSLTGDTIFRYGTCRGEYHIEGYYLIVSYILNESVNQDMNDCISYINRLARIQKLKIKYLDIL